VLAVARARELRRLLCEGRGSVGPPGASGEQHHDSDFDNFVQDTAARFTCSTETAADFAFHCQSRGTDLDVDLAIRLYEAAVQTAAPFPRQ
jgi:hypothetical protein